MVQAAQITKVNRVRGNATAQYTPKPGFQSKVGIEKRDETNVPGRKNIVTTANVFMLELSR